MLRVLYVFFTGLLLATFVGVGIAAFYPAPELPEYPEELERVNICIDNGRCPTFEGYSDPSEQQQITADEHEAELKAYDEAMQAYARNVSITSFVIALIFAIIGLATEKQLKLISDGVLLGGLFTLVYGIGWGFATEDDVYRFVVVTIGLIVVLVLGYLKFVKPDQKKS